MVATCEPYLQFDAVRVTKLTSCGALNDTGCSFATSEGVISLSMTAHNQDRQEYIQLNGQGNVCVNETKEAQLLWVEFELTFCNVDPDLFNIVTSEPLVVNDEATPRSIGWDTTTDAPLNSFFALEGWTNMSGDQCTDGTPDYGYFLLPFCMGAQVGDITLENANINFTVKGRTHGNSLWGTGPYNVRLGEIAPNLGVPLPLISSVGTKVHRRQFVTELPPPINVCGCQDVTPALVVTPTSGTAATPRVMTIPVDANGPILPGYAIWGDASAPQLITSGTTVNHTYAVGTYTPSYKPVKYSTPSYVAPLNTVT